MSLIAAYGLLAHALIFGAIAAFVPFGPMRQKVALAATTMALVVGIAPGLHGVFGMPSVTLLVLALLQLAGKTPSPLSLRPAMTILAFAAVFYLSAWGMGPFDPYGLGYQPWAILAALIPVGLALWWRGMSMWLLILTIDLAAYAAGVFPNLWDVLIDPLLVLVAATIAGRHGLQRFIATRNR